MKDNNIVIVDFTKEPNPYITGDLFAFDYGQQLRLIAPDMPEYAEVHFSWHRTDKGAITQVGVKDGDDLLVTIPEFIIAKESNHDYFFHVWLYPDTAPHSAESAYHARLRVIARAKPVYYAGMPFNPFSDVLRKIRNWIDNVVTPKAKVEDTEEGHLLTVKDADGVTTVLIIDGKDGKDAKIDDTLSVIGYAAEAYSTGFEIRKLQKYNEKTAVYVTPEMFGAVGDGVTDDYDAFYDALLTNKPLILQNKTYKIKRSLVLNRKVMVGSGINSILDFENNTGLIIEDRYSLIGNFTLQGDNTGTAITLSGESTTNHRNVFENITINNFDKGISNTALTWVNIFRNVRFNNCSKGIEIKVFTGSNFGLLFDTVYFNDCVNNITGKGFHAKFLNCNFGIEHENSFVCDTGSHLIFDGCNFECDAKVNTGVIFVLSSDKYIFKNSSFIIRGGNSIHVFNISNSNLVYFENVNYKTGGDNEMPDANFFNKSAFTSSGYGGIVIGYGCKTIPRPDPYNAQRPNLLDLEEVGCITFYGTTIDKTKLYEGQKLWNYQTKTPCVYNGTNVVDYSGNVII